MCSRVFVYVCDIVSIDSFHSFHVRERKRSIFLRVRFIVESNRERRRRRRNSCDKFHLASTSVAETQFCQNNTLSYVSIVICFVSIHVFAAILRVRACFVVISSFIIAFQTILNVPRTTLTEMLRNTLTQTRRGSDEAATRQRQKRTESNASYVVILKWILYESELTACENTCVQLHRPFWLIDCGQTVHLPSLLNYFIIFLLLFIGILEIETFTRQRRDVSRRQNTGNFDWSRAFNYEIKIGISFGHYHRQSHARR